MVTAKPQAYKVAILWLVLITYAIILIDNSLIFTGSLQIEQDLHMTVRNLAWISDAYSLSFGGFLLLSGRASDVWGRRKVYLIGLMLFGAGSLLVGLSPTSLFMINARFFQGIGASILAPTVMALLLDTFHGDEQSRAIAYHGAMAGFGTAFGLVLGGLFASLWSWRVGFFVNVPISALLFWCGRKLLPSGERRSMNLDVAGAALSVIAMLMIVFGILQTQHAGWWIVTGLIFLGIFVIWEQRATLPLLPLRIFGDRERASALVARFFYMGAMLSLSYRIPQYLQAARHWQPLQAGIGMLPFSLVIFIGSMQVAWLRSRVGNKRVMVIGASLTLIGLAALRLLGTSKGYWVGMGFPLMLTGFGQGLTLAPLTVSGVARIQPKDAGTASGVVNVMHQMGMSVGLSLVIGYSADLPTMCQRFNRGMTVTMLLCAVALVIVILGIVWNRHTE